MAQQPPPIHFEDILLDEARHMGRGPRMDPALYQAFKEKIQSLDNSATRITLPEGTSPTTMKNRLLRVAAELNTPITVRRILGGLLFWGARPTRTSSKPKRSVPGSNPPGSPDTRPVADAADANRAGLIGLWGLLNRVGTTSTPRAGCGSAIIS